MSRWIHRTHIVEKLEGPGTMTLCGRALAEVYSAITWRILLRRLLENDVKTRVCINCRRAVHE